MQRKLSYMEMRLARRLAWAKKENLHFNAVRYARRYPNLDETMLKLISAYEYATSMSSLPYSSVDEHDARETAMRNAWDNVIKYVRTLEPQRSVA